MAGSGGVAVIGQQNLTGSNQPEPAARHEASDTKFGNVRSRRRRNGVLDQVKKLHPRLKQNQSDRCTAMALKST
jgi:hypothetical protein